MVTQVAVVGKYDVPVRRKDLNLYQHPLSKRDGGVHRGLITTALKEIEIFDVGRQ